MAKPWLIRAAAYASGGEIRQILTLAWPMILTALVVSLSQNGPIWILGTQSGGQRALYTLSMLQPFYFIFIALLEGLTITNQIFSARSVSHWAPGRVLHSSAIFSVVGGLLLVVLATGSRLGDAGLQVIYPNDEPALFSHFLPAYLLSVIPLLVLELCNAGLRGQGKTAVSMLCVCLFIVINLTVCFVSLHCYQNGFMAVIYANLIAALAVLPFSAWWLFNTVTGKTDPQPQAFLPRLLAMTADAGVPIFLTMLFAFASSAVLFPLLSQLGAAYASGFLIVVKLRAFFIIPAVALGSAIAIGINQRLSTDSPQQLNRWLGQGLGGIALTYIGLTAAAYLAQTGMVNMMSVDSEVRVSAHAIMRWLLPTFFITSLIASIQTMLEQLGRGKRVLLITFIMESLMAAIVLYVATQPGALVGLMKSILIFNVLYLVVLTYEYGKLCHGIGQQHAL
ncbi:MATE family efflux transporter [Lonsdalea quercina]|uniref:MATE family efflux transporter n=1 Tax=Lonsdalea quercina TaxID=71657 RepID=UPI0039756BFE